MDNDPRYIYTWCHTATRTSSNGEKIQQEAGASVDDLTFFMLINIPDHTNYRLPGTL